MSRRKTLLIIALVLVCISLVVAYALSRNNVGGSSEATPQDNPTETPEFVIPENPVGILGLLIASVAALGIFAAAKKIKYSPNFRL